MEHMTVGKRYNSGKIARVECIKNDPLLSIHIKDTCFLLLVVEEGSATFQIAGRQIAATAPCFVCFDETEDPVLVQKYKLKCMSVYFHPEFLNVNLTFPLIRSDYYGDLAHIHDMFLLRPFLDHRYIIPITENFLEAVHAACGALYGELIEQRDWYWSCRGRSFFLELMIALERLYGLIGRGEDLRKNDNSAVIDDENIKAAVLFIESHYAEPITLADVEAASGLNHTTLTNGMRENTGMTTMKYLINFRISVAEKLLAFTSLPLKEVADRCGFKTMPHFSREFKAQTGKTPAVFRTEAVEKRKAELKLIR